jgi:prepilin-type N-terminal cleavage/methylation domain-containing protein
MKTRKRSAGFTLIEVMIVVVVILVLTGVAAGAYQRAVSTVMEVKCMNNLKTLGRALETYRLANQVYPPGYPEPDLRQLLSPHVDGVEASFAFECPCHPLRPIDRMRNIIGYDEFYIEKKISEDEVFNVVINCPHHGADTLTLLTDGAVERAIAAPVLHTVSGELYPGQIAVGGQMTFADGSLVSFEGQQCANLILSLESALGSEGVHNKCDEIMRLLPGEIGDFQIEVLSGQRFCVMTCVADLNAEGKKDGLIVDLWTYYGKEGGQTPRSGPYTLCIMPRIDTKGHVKIREAPQTRIEGPNPVKPGDVTYVIDVFTNPQIGGRCTPPAPID